MFKQLKAWSKKLKEYLIVLYLVIKRKELPWYTRIFVLILIGYAFSPIDFIPDFIPILGYLDDVILLPIGIWISIKLIPRDLLETCKIEAKQISKEKIPTFKFVGIIIIFIWILILLLIGYYLLDDLLEFIN